MIKVIINILQKPFSINGRLSRWVIVNIPLLTLLVAAACACHKETPIYTDEPILMSAKESGTTKGLLDADSFADPGTQLKIYDYYTPTTGTAYYYINGDIAESDGTIWPFKNESYKWTTDGVHKFFGWLEQGDNLKINQLFTPTFEDQTLTIPATTISQYAQSLCLPLLLSVLIDSRSCNEQSKSKPGLILTGISIAPFLTAIWSTDYCVVAHPNLFSFLRIYFVAILTC